MDRQIKRSHPSEHSVVPEKPSGAPALDRDPLHDAEESLPFVARLYRISGAEHLQVTGLAGSGAFAVVFTALDTTTGKEVAVKCSIYANDTPAAKEFLLREPAFHKELSGAKHVIELMSEGEGKLRALGDLPDKWDNLPLGTPVRYLVFEKFDGTLADILPDSYNPSCLPSRIQVCRDICAGVLELHERGIVHRDITPANVLISQYDGGIIAKIADLGIAMKLGEPADDVRMHQGGKPGFAAPEFLVGTSPDLRMDVYSLGVLFHHVITGRSPFSDTHMAQLRRVTPATVHSIPKPDISNEIPVALRALITTMMDVNKEARPSASSVLEDLDRIERGEQTAAVSSLGVYRRVLDWYQRNIEPRTEEMQRAAFAFLAGVGIVAGMTPKFEPTSGPTIPLRQRNESVKRLTCGAFDSLKVPVRPQNVMNGDN